MHPFSGDFAAQRNRALELVDTPWVLMLDADERVQPDLAEHLHRVVRSGADSASVHHLNLLEGDPTPFLWPDRHPRFFRSHFRYAGRVHEQLQGTRSTVYLPLSGPFIEHHKTRMEHYRDELRYAAIDPSVYSAEYLDSIRRRLREEGETLG